MRDSEASEPETEWLYSGVVQKHDVRDSAWSADPSDLLNVSILRRGDEEFLFIETKAEPVRAMIRLDKRQANALFRCMRNAVARWDGREP